MAAPIRDLPAPPVGVLGSIPRVFLIQLENSVTAAAMVQRFKAKIDRQEVSHVGPEIKRLRRLS